MHDWQRNLILITTFGLSSSLLVGCQLYRNNSRELFEKNSPAKIINSDIGSKSIKIHECWNQNIYDPLPPLPEEQFPNQFFYTQKNNIDGPNQEVCLAENIPDNRVSSFK